MSSTSSIAYRYIPRKGATKREINREIRHESRSITAVLRGKKSLELLEVPENLDSAVFMGSPLKTKAHSMLRSSY
ncbi:MAG: hypothetical protein KGI06_01810 [Candidatus Micrarchaeota archaeon]|nr:hypothetical protein [Candidatus Micrarchaeota archaeon]